MFPDSSIAHAFKLGRTKCAYMINHGLAPYFRDTLIEKVQKCNYFVICFDESLNKVVQRGQMDLCIRYFDDSTLRVCTSYLNSSFMGQY